jgi:DNA-directed RNA polymerase subunit RPC12/RpoP
MEPGYGAIVAIGFVLLLWWALSRFWASSIQRFEPLLHDSALRTRYGWRCPRCRTTHAPDCPVPGCGGALFWVQNDTRIKCARCHRYLIAHPWLFSQLPRPRRVACRQCRWSGRVSNWKIT